MLSILLLPFFLFLLRLNFDYVDCELECSGSETKEVVEAQTTNILTGAKFQKYRLVLPNRSQ